MKNFNAGVDLFKTLNVITFASIFILLILSGAYGDGFDFLISKGWSITSGIFFILTVICNLFSLMLLSTDEKSNTESEDDDFFVIFVFVSMILLILGIISMSIGVWVKMY